MLEAVVGCSCWWQLLVAVCWWQLLVRAGGSLLVAVVGEGWWPFVGGNCGRQLVGGSFLVAVCWWQLVGGSLLAAVVGGSCWWQTLCMLVAVCWWQLLARAGGWNSAIESCH